MKQSEVLKRLVVDWAVREDKGKRKREAEKGEEGRTADLEEGKKDEKKKDRERDKNSDTKV